MNTLRAELRRLEEPLTDGEIPRRSTGTVENLSGKLQQASAGPREPMMLTLGTPRKCVAEDRGALD
jgi:hypothetical protein